MRRVVGGKVYDTKTADLVASDRFFDGSGFERDGRNTFLYRTQKGHFFLFKMTQWQDERDELLPLSIERAKKHYKQLQEQNVEYKDAFGEESGDGL